MNVNEIDQIKQFMTGGKAEFTIESLASGTHFTYRLRKIQGGSGYFVSVLNGPDNTADYAYVGILTADFKLVITRASKPGSKSFGAFDWFVNQLTNPTKLHMVQFHHTGKCARCGRKLTTPESVEAGFGPECIKML